MEWNGIELTCVFTRWVSIVVECMRMRVLVYEWRRKSNKMEIMSCFLRASKWMRGEQSAIVCECVYFGNKDAEGEWRTEWREQYETMLPTTTS